MNRVRVQRATALFMTAEVGFWMKCFACWGRSSDLTRKPPSADFYVVDFCFVCSPPPPHANPLRGIHILSLYFYLLLLFL